MHKEIYLVGVTKFNQAHIDLLKSRNIVLIDLSFFNDPKTALNSFINEIKKNNRNELNLSWKELSDHHEDEMHQIQEIIPIWKKERLAHPGWLIMPHELREQLLQQTETWVKFNLPIEFYLSLDGLDYCYELLWRFEKSLEPIWSGMETILEKVIENYLLDSDKERNQKAIFIVMAMLRFYRENGLWQKWGIA